MTKVGKVFLSHASKDKPFVDRLASDLEKHSIPVWYDKFDLKIGESVPGKINEGIADAQYFAIVLSPAAINSKWVIEELNAGLMKRERRNLPTSNPAGRLLNPSPFGS